MSYKLLSNILINCKGDIPNSFLVSEKPPHQYRVCLLNIIKTDQITHVCLNDDSNSCNTYLLFRNTVLLLLMQLSFPFMFKDVEPINFYEQLQDIWGLYCIHLLKISDHYLCQCLWFQLSFRHLFRICSKNIRCLAIVVVSLETWPCVSLGQGALLITT